MDLHLQWYHEQKWGDQTVVGICWIKFEVDEVGESISAPAGRSYR